MINFLIEKYLDGFDARSILDIGPGYGAFGRLAASVTGATEITLVDCDAKVLAWQTDEYRKVGLTALGVQQPISVDVLANLSGPFGLILCQEFLEHVLNGEEIVQALAEQLEPDGRIIISVPTKISERWLKFINPSYMRNEPYGHVTQYDKRALMSVLSKAGLSPLVFISTQPHFFLGHTWLNATRMKAEGSTGKVLTKGIRGAVFSKLTSYSQRVFLSTGPELWGRILPRNYFVVATKQSAAATTNG